ncbi:hypothetical protein ASZ90_015412 [hydrocarbon metagenome]|uniref:Uncharacterized protein n=1 Tax=hydrocarbon metagenome TaxID=938273 RepID=A0A0W8F226_9ZZZZ
MCTPIASNTCNVHQIVSPPPFRPPKNPPCHDFLSRQAVFLKKNHSPCRGDEPGFTDNLKKP